MAFSLGKTTLLFVLALLLALAYADVLGEDVDVEEMEDMDLAEAVRQEEEEPVPAPGDPENEASSDRPRGVAPAPPPPARVCGVFILCERKGVFGGGPSAALIQGEEGVFRVRTIGACRNFRVRGTCQRKSSFNHARLWPVNNEEFNEMCFYRETKHACLIGTVQVIKRLNGVTTVEYECTQNFDAHTVRFCMYRNSNLC